MEFAVLKDFSGEQVKALAVEGIGLKKDLIKEVDRLSKLLGVQKVFKFSDPINTDLDTLKGVHKALKKMWDEKLPPRSQSELDQGKEVQKFSAEEQKILTVLDVTPEEIEAAKDR